MAAITAEWWESVCIELSRNPVGATKTITEFRDTEQALDASKYFLQPTTGCSPVAQFQAALVLQYVCLKHWNKLSAADTQELRGTLWTLLHSSIAAGTMPSFALNKIMQVYALLWKRGWTDSDHNCKQQLFQQIRAFMQKEEYMKAGATLLRIVVEEFCSRSSAEIGLPMEFHRLAHNAFHQSGLDEGLEISAQFLSVSFSALSALTDSPSAVIAAATTASAACKLVVEVLNWDFGSNEKFSFGLNKETERESRRSTDLLALPRKWFSTLMTERFIGDVFNAYQQLRAIYIHFTFSKAVNDGFVRSIESETLVTLEGSMSELRLLITALSSITGNISVTRGSFYTPLSVTFILQSIIMHCCLYVISVILIISLIFYLVVNLL